MHIGLYTPCWLNAGVERWYLTLVSEVSRLRPDITWSLCCTGEHSPESLAAPTALGICSVSIDELLARSGVILTWGHTAFEPRWTRWPGRIVHVIHNDDTWTRRCARAAQAIGCRDFVAVSDRVTRLSPEPCRVIRNGVDARRLISPRSRDEVQSEWRSRLPRPSPDDDQPTVYVGHVGRLDETQKRPLAAALAARGLQDRGIPAVAVYYWTGAEPPQFFAQARTAARGQIVCVRDSQVAEAFAAIDCLVVASAFEAFCFSLCEAWLTGTPTVSTPVGVAPELAAQHGPLTTHLAHTDAYSSAALATAVLSAIASSAITRRAAEVAAVDLSTELFAKLWAAHL
jgi:glycosyltransferase involved in cell wall biosynthesis